MYSLTGLLPSPTPIINHVLSTISPNPNIPHATATMIPTSTTVQSLLSSTASSPSFLALVSATASAVPWSEQEDPKHGGAKNGECQLLGPFALFVQGALGALALLSLVYKRWRERPQRPVKIWAFDASKQVVGSALLHVANLLMSMVSSGELFTPTAVDGYQANPCSFYLLNLAIDTTLGIPILIVLLKILTHGFSLTPMANPRESIQSGNYGHPPKAAWWLKQSFIYFLGLLGMKACVFFIFQLCPWLSRVGDWALKWTEGNERVQVFFVMLFFPVVMNAIQYYIIDSFIKNQTPSDHEPIPSEDGEVEDRNADRSVHRRIPRAQGRDIDGPSEFEDEDENGKDSERLSTSGAENKSPPAGKLQDLEIDAKKRHDYDPDKDGDKTPISVGSRNATSNGGEESSSMSSKDARAQERRESAKSPR